MTVRRAPESYDPWPADLKSRSRAARLRAALAATSQLIALYWSIECDILGRLSDQGWRAKIVSRLAADLLCEFPDTKGFSFSPSRAPATAKRSLTSRAPCP